MAQNMFDYDRMESASVAREIARAAAEQTGAIARKQREESAIPEPHLHQPGSALHITLSELQMLWRSRFGDGWVTETELRSEPYYRVAATRLSAAGQAERLTVSGAALYDVYRIRDADADR